MSSNLSKHILATVTYYDVMDYPMTSFEIWKNLTIISGEEEEKYSLLEVISDLESEKLKRFIMTEKGFYFLRDRQGLVQQRFYRHKVSERKFKKLLKMVAFLRFLPYIKMVGVTGSMAMKNSKENSDFDLLIIFKSGKMFTARALVTFSLQLLGRRRYGQKISNRICLNHFITDDFLVAGRDIFSSNEYSFLIPLYGFSEFLKFQEKNYWMKKFKPNFFTKVKNRKEIKDGSFSLVIKNFFEEAFESDFIEERLKKWQKNKILNNPKTKQAGSMIICEDNELAFWPNYENQGPKIFSNFKERLSQISQM